MEIRLHIDRLILDGVTLAPHEKPLFQAALEAELARLLAEGGLAQSFTGGISVPAVSAGPIAWDASLGPQNLGQQVARAMYGGIGQPVPKTQAGK